MSDEEKKAIERLKDLISKSKVIGDIEINKQVVFKDIETILNLIKKQSKEIERTNEILIWKQKHEEQLQKEIEELKKPKYVINCKTNEITKLTNDFVSKVKIKAKIEELEKEITEDKKKNDDFWSDYSIYLDAQREGFQSLLEKE